MNDASTLNRSALRAAAAVLALVVVSSSPGWAGDSDPVVEVTRDGTIEGVVIVGAPPDVVRSYLEDIAHTRKLSKDVTDVIVRKDGACQIVTTHASSFIDVSYVARRCPTQTGWIETLVESESFSDYYAEWFVRPVSAGHELRFRLRTDMDIPVPARLIRGALKKNVTATLERIQDELGEPHAPPLRIAEP